MNGTIILFFRMMLYLMSIYSIVNIAITFYRKNTAIFAIHIVTAMLLLLNLIGLVVVKIFSFEIAETFIFDYGMTIVLIVLNLTIWWGLYRSSENVNNSIHVEDLKKKLDISDITYHNKEINRKLLDLASS